MNQELAVVTPAQDEDQGNLIQIIQLPIIMERLAELKEFWKSTLADAVAMEASEETLQQIESLRAMNNRLFAQLEARRKEVKAAIEAPYKQFKVVYDDCATNLHQQADAILRDKANTVKDTMKSACEQRLRDFFDELTQAHGIEFLKFEQAGIKISMADAKAKTQPPNKLREQLEKFVCRVSKDVDMILAFENAAEIMAVYKQTLNATQAIADVNDRHRQIEQAQAEQDRRRAAKAQEAEVVRKVEAFAPPVVETPEPAADLLTCTFTVNDTRERLILLKRFLDDKGYKYTS